MTGWQEIDGTRYYFNASGVMQIGEVEIDGEIYFFDENGANYIPEPPVQDEPVDESEAA